MAAGNHDGVSVLAVFFDATQGAVGVPQSDSDSRPTLYLPSRSIDVAGGGGGGGGAVASGVV